MSKNKSIKIKRALISVSDKEGIVDFARKLYKLNIEIISTGGTEKLLRKNKIPVVSAEKFSGSPEMMGGRVKTLVPQIHGGILSRRKEDKEEIKKYGIKEIDLVVVNLYPFEEKIKKPGIELEEAIENIDIGGPTMLRSAAKNFFHVAVVSSPNLYDPFITNLKNDNGKCSYETRKNLSLKAFEHVANYDVAIANFLSTFNGEIPENIFSSHKLKQVLRYGENPHQKGVFYPNSKPYFEQIHGKEISYNNLVDIEAAIQLISEFKEETVFGILKHNNACGISTGKNVADAYKKAFAADTTSAFGGVLISNKEIDKEAAAAMNDLFFEILISPSFTSDALEILKTKKNRILLQLDRMWEGDMVFKSMLNGVLAQDYDSKTDAKSDLKTVTKKAPTDSEVEDLIFASKVCKHSKSNTIVLVKDQQMVASGVGQTSRVDALEHAIHKARNFGFNLKGAVMASDAFFPFPDCVEIANKAGITAVIQPGGSVKDQLSIDYCDDNGLAMVFTGTRHFKH